MDFSPRTLRAIFRVNSCFLVYELQERKQCVPKWEALMSAMNTFLRTGTVLAAGAAALVMTACSSTGQSTRYGNVYDYEGGAYCEGAACSADSRYGDSGYVAPAPVATYPAPVPAQENVIYADCSVVSGMSCPTQTQSYPVYTQQTTSVTSAPAQCPAGTIAQGDGTCMQTSTTGYSSTTTTSTSYSGSSMADCPAGTTMQADGTCMQSSSSWSSSSSSSTSYSGSSYGTTTTSCPSGTTLQADGTCSMNEGYSVEIYDSGSTGYQTEGYTPRDYRPVRK